MSEDDTEPAGSDDADDRDDRPRAGDAVSSTTVAIVLAAGGGRRFGGPRHKLLTELGGVPVARRSIDTAREAAIGPVVVVSGAVDPVADGWPEGAPSDVTVVHNPDWSEGQATSLQLGLDEARRRGAAAVVVGLADQPFVSAEAWRRIAASRSPIAVATYDGRRRNPVRLASEVWPALPAHGDAGARSIIRLRPELVEDVPCPGSPDDIDTWEDLASWQSRSSTNSP